MVSQRAIRRLQREFLQLKTNPIQFVKYVKPMEDNILEFHFCVSVVLSFNFN